MTSIALGILLIVASVFLIIAVLMQSSKSHKLSGTIAGGAETFFGKTKGSSIDKKLSKLTTVVAIVFVIAVLAVYLLQDTSVQGEQNNGDIDINVETVDSADETGAAAESGAIPVETTDAPAETTEAPAETTAASAE